jgi:hypothetical protein
MSHPAPPKPPGLLTSTQQQLAELDALLERMLALPVNRLDEPDCAQADVATLPPATNDPAPPDGGDQAPPHPPGEAPALNTLQASEGAGFATGAETPELVSPPVREWGEDNQPAPFGPPHFPLFTNLEWQEIPEVPATTTALDPPPAADESLAFPALGPLPPPTRPQPRVKGPIPLGLRPLLWPNQAFDRYAAALGAPGRWLSGPSGRSVIGWTGLLLLAAAAAWGLLDWMGWI